MRANYYTSEFRKLLEATLFIIIIIIIIINGACSCSTFEQTKMEVNRSLI